jgi:hypothetical protein
MRLRSASVCPSSAGSKGSSVGSSSAYLRTRRSKSEDAILHASKQSTILICTHDKHHKGGHTSKKPHRPPRPTGCTTIWRLSTPGAGSQGTPPDAARHEGVSHRHRLHGMLCRCSTGSTGPYHNWNNGNRNRSTLQTVTAPNNFTSASALFRQRSAERINVGLHSASLASLMASTNPLASARRVNGLRPTPSVTEMPHRQPPHAPYRLDSKANTASCRATPARNRWRTMLVVSIRRKSPPTSLQRSNNGSSFPMSSAVS